MVFKPAWTFKSPRELIKYKVAWETTQLQGDKSLMTSQGWEGQNPKEAIGALNYDGHGYQDGHSYFCRIQVPNKF